MLKRNCGRIMVHAVEKSGFARTYVISGSDGLMAVDVGSVGAAEDVVAYIEKTPGIALSDVKYITATHFHIDHIGGIGHLLSRCSPDTKVLFHHLVMDYLAGRRKLSLMRNWVVGLLPTSLLSARSVRSFSHLKFESLAGLPLPGLRNLLRLPYGNEKIGFFGGGGGLRHRIGFDDWDALSTPGHTEDSVAFFSESSGDLICGDLIVNVRAQENGRLNRFYSDGKATVASYRLLCDTTRPTALYPGHGEVIAGGGDLLSRVRVFDA